MTENKKQCRLCGGTLSKRRTNARFCSDTHRVQWHLDKQRKERDYRIVVLRSVIKACLNEASHLHGMVNDMLVKAGLKDEVFY